jgi:hypothetical protein
MEKTTPKKRNHAIFAADQALSGIESSLSRSTNTMDEKLDRVLAGMKTLSEDVAACRLQLDDVNRYVTDWQANRHRIANKS